MRSSTIAVLVGAALFVVPLPGTFTTGGLLVLAGLLARVLGR